MFNELDPLLHSQLRLMIMSVLVANQESDFNNLKDITKATSGNLSIQIKKLQEADYIEVSKSYKDNYPHTSLKITAKGVAAFEKYVIDLQEYLQPKV